MRHRIGTIREFNTRNFTVIVDAIEEDSPDFSFDETGEVSTKVESGEWICFCARARVLIHGREIGTDYLGNRIYENVEDFEDHRECGKQNRSYELEGTARRCGSYFSDMIHEAISRARKTLKKEQSIKVRA